ncbi:MAG: DNA-binding protein WhiA [Clostridia bacterium]|nr:DNA-binding protein WhiA [Clostridia bacterium]
MANFTSGIKREFLAIKRNENSRESRVACMSAFLRAGGSISFTGEGLGFVVTTESERIAEYYLAELDALYGISCLTKAQEDRLSGRDKLTIAYNGAAAYDILTEFGVFEPIDGGSMGIYSGIPSRIVANDESRLAYIRGAFLGGGSCTVPRGEGKTGYHLEFIFSNEKAAEDFTALLAEYELIAKTVTRKGSFVVYLTSLAAISDFLAVTGAINSLKKLNDTAEKREENNNNNRANNCFVGNMDRTATAAAAQCLAIKKLKDQGILNMLDDELKRTAEARVKYAEASLRELAELLGISKSCLNHRLRKLTLLEEESSKTE